MRALSPLVPAKAGTQGDKGRFWIPAYAGMSGGESHTSQETVRPNSSQPVVENVAFR
jgi:hypothetical protein